MFDRLVADFKNLLTLPGPYLYTIAHPTYPDASTLKRLIDLVSRRSADHRFDLLVVGRDGHDSDLSALGNRVGKAWRTPNVGDKPLHLAWEGHDASWDRALAPYRLGFHSLGFHDSGPPRIGAGEPEPIAAGPRAPHANFPSYGAEVVWEAGPAAVYSNSFWRDAGAQLEVDGAAAILVTPPVAWFYAHAVNLDFEGIDFERDHAWLRVVLEDVGGGPLLASLFDSETNAIAEESLADQGPGPFEIVLKVRDSRKTVLLFRTGARGDSARARLTKVQLLRDRV
jgi:hypothetical protein